MDAVTVRQYRTEACRNLQQRAEAPSPDGCIRALLDTKDGRILNLADALLDTLEDR